MIKLNDRLQMIADQLKNEKTMADIGTDHGFLPIFLLQSKRCQRVIMGDISAPSLSKAKENSRRYFTGEYINCLEHADFRTGDGLAILGSGEVDAVVIAGMGGKLITEILASDIKHTCSFNKFILQPRIGQGILRKWLCDNGFKIVHEGLVKEGNFIPEIITVLPPIPETSGKPVLNKGFGAGDNAEIYYQVPPWILSAKGPVEEFLERKLKKEENILEQIMLSAERNRDFEEIRCENIYYLKNLLEQARQGA